MANYFVDSTTGDDVDNGTTMDLAWATLTYAIQSGGLSAGDTVWVRRAHSEAPTEVIDLTADGTPADMISIIGWPRNSDSSITSATWTNGSTTVDLIVGLSMDREKHLGRFITGPDGFDYLITKITDSNTIVIDREYPSSTVSGASGAATIKADEDYATAQAVDDSGWTITKTDWNADADDLPQIDFSGGAYNFYMNTSHCFYFANFDVVGGTGNPAILYARISKGSMVRGVIGTVSSNVVGMYISYSGAAVVGDRIILVGNGGTVNQKGFRTAGSYLKLMNSAAYNFGGNGLYCSGSKVELDNVNLGVEANNGSEDIYLEYMHNIVFGRDVNLGAANGTVAVSYPTFNRCSFENYGKILGAHFDTRGGGTITKTDVVAGSGDPYKRTGGADSVIEIQFDVAESATGSYTAPSRPELADKIFVHEFEASTGSQTYRYYVQAEGAVTAAQLFIEAEYVSAYDDSSEYAITLVKSDEAITARDDETDWDQYIEVTVNPAVASKVRIKCYCSYYHATNKIYIDPAVEVS